MLIYFPQFFVLPPITVSPLVAHLFPVEWKLARVRNYIYAICSVGFPVAQRVKNLPALWETCVQVLGRGDSPREGNGYPIQYSCLENSKDRGERLQRVGHDLAANTFTTKNDGGIDIEVCKSVVI